MFRKNEGHRQEKLTSIVKELPPSTKKDLENDWTTTFYEHVFCKIDEDKFTPLYSDVESRPNKPVNELVSLEIMKTMSDWTDKELRKEYLYDLRVNNALGKEDIGRDPLSLKTLVNFRGRLAQYEKETGINLMKEVFKEIRDDTMEEFDIDGRIQRMDSSLVEANIKNLSRLGLFVRVVHNFLKDLPDNELDKIPDGIREYEQEESLNLPYRLKREEAKEMLEKLADHLVWIVDRYGGHKVYSQLKSFEHVWRVLDEQCYRIPELEQPDEEDEETEEDKPQTWEPVKKRREVKEDTEENEDTSDDVPRGENEDDSSDSEDNPKRVGLKDPEEIHSDYLQNPYDEDATYRKKNGEWHQGFKSNWCETCGEENPFQVITWVDVDTNNTEDSEMLKRCVEDLSKDTGLEDLLDDGAYSGEEVEKECEKNGVTQHFSGIKGPEPTGDRIPLCDAEFDDHKMTGCPMGYEPFEQRYNPDTGWYGGRMKKEVCDGCSLREKCFVKECKKFYSYGFYHRQLIVSRKREKLKCPDYRKFLQLRAGAESMINEAYHKTGKRTKYTGTGKVNNTTTAQAIGVNAKRIHRYQKKTQKWTTPLKQLGF